MQGKFLVKFLTITLLLINLNIYSQHEVPEENREGSDLKAEIKKDIDHHIQDSHSFVFFTDSESNKSYGFSLPVILWDNSLHLFSSSEFHHGETVAESKGNFYTLYHSKIYRTDAEGTINLDDHHHATNAKPLDFSITKNVFMIIVTALIMFLLFSGLAKSFKKGPIVKGAGRFFEPKINYIKYMSYLLTVFFFVWFLNLFGLTPLGINVTGNIAITFALAIITFVITQVSGNKNYWKHIFWMPGVPVPMKII